MITEEEWKNKLTAEEYYILREKGTEKPFSGKYLTYKENGIYTCRGCGTELFLSTSKFDAHCGWPSFDQEYKKGNITYTADYSQGMNRIEITCSNCGGHLGHIFNDGPTQTGLRYCVNSVSLDFKPMEATTANNLQTATFGGGCFWCTEAIFQRLEGVVKVESGYSGGGIKNPTYKEVCTGTTGHAEVIQITYDSFKVSFIQLLEVFFKTHDPTTLNRQGNDVGTQYRSAVFYHNETQQQLSLQIIQELTQQQIYDQPIVTEVTAFTYFYPAEDYHQNYYNENKENNEYCKLVVVPKVEKFEKLFKDKLKK